MKTKIRMKQKKSQTSNILEHLGMSWTFLEIIGNPFGILENLGQSGKICENIRTY